MSKTDEKKDVNSVLKEELLLKLLTERKAQRKSEKTKGGFWQEKPTSDPKNTQKKYLQLPQEGSSTIMLKATPPVHEVLDVESTSESDSGVDRPREKKRRLPKEFLPLDAIVHPEQRLSAEAMPRAKASTEAYLPPFFLDANAHAEKRLSAEAMPRAKATLTEAYVLNNIVERATQHAEDMLPTLVAMSSEFFAFIPPPNYQKFSDTMQLVVYEAEKLRRRFPY